MLINCALPEIIHHPIKARYNMPIVQTIPKLTCNLFQCCKVMEKIPVTNPLLEPPNEFNYRLVYNEDSTSNACLEIYSAYSRNFKNKQDT